MSQTIPILTRCTDCGVQLEPDEAEAATHDNRPRCDSCFWAKQRTLIDSQPRPSQRFLHDVTCVSCGHDFITDAKSLAPEGCPECGFLDVARPAPYRTARLLKAAHAHLTNTHETLSMLRRERVAK